MFLFPSRQLLKNQILAGLLQHPDIVSPHLIEHAVCQSLETEYIDIHDRMIRRKFHKFLLRRHRKLFRHDHEEILLRMLPRLFHDLPINIFCFTASRTSQYKL